MMHSCTRLRCMAVLSIALSVTDACCTAVLAPLAPVLLKPPPGTPPLLAPQVTCTYLFHEIPTPVRRAAVAEMFRVLKPGGLCVFKDSAQLGDRPEQDSVMGLFGGFNEPHYVGYINTDLGELFAQEGFQCGTKYLASASKTLSFVKPKGGGTGAGGKKAAMARGKAAGGGERRAAPVAEGSKDWQQQPEGVKQGSQQ